MSDMMDGSAFVVAAMVVMMLVMMGGILVGGGRWIPRNIKRHRGE